MTRGFLRILNELHDHQVDFVIVGDVAVALHGGSRVTFDLDIVPRLAPDSWPAAVEARHAVRIDQLAIVEAFPTTFLGAMLEEPPPHGRRQRSDVYYADLAANRSFERLVRRLLGPRTWSREPRGILNHDDRAAFVCALTALSVALGEFAAVGDERDGWIILPPQWAFADWAWVAASETARLEALEPQSEPAGRLLSFPESQPASER